MLSCLTDKKKREKERDSGLKIRTYSLLSPLISMNQYISYYYLIIIIIVIIIIIIIIIIILQS